MICLHCPNTARRIFPRRFYKMRPACARRRPLRTAPRLRAIMPQACIRNIIKWTACGVLLKKSRMDCVPVLAPDGELRIVEFRNLVQGDSVVLGRTDDGSEGILMHTEGFSAGGKSAEAFAFRTGRSRETAFTRDYDALAGLLRHEKEHGNVVWVLGPACSFDASAKAAMQALIENGYAHGLLAGNALATHDLEGSLLHTALGQDIYTQESRPNGHYHHIDVINAARAAGSIPAFIEQNGIRDGIMHACVAHGVPYVLAGSIRDDGPLPGVYGDVYAAQNAMRELVQQATTVICVATQLHTIATGNMTPSYCVRGGRVRPVYLYCVDISEFVTNKLRDRGSLSSVPIVANAQDFLCRVAAGLGLPVAEKYDKINR